MPKTLPPFVKAIDAIHATMKELVLQVAAERGSVRYHTSYADNYWTVTVYADGRVLNENYAEEQRGPHSRIEDLSLIEMAGLLDAIERSTSN